MIYSFAFYFVSQPKRFYTLAGVFFFSNYNFTFSVADARVLMFSQTGFRPTVMFLQIVQNIVHVVYDDIFLPIQHPSDGTFTRNV